MIADASQPEAAARCWEFFFLREEMHLRIQLPRGSWYVGLRGARRDYPLKPHGGRNMMIYEKAVTRDKSRSLLSRTWVTQRVLTACNSDA
jgi:hypothetical protein